MKKSNRFLLVLITMFFSLFSTKAFSHDKVSNMDNSCDGTAFEQFLDDVAIVYGVHSQLKHEGHSIPAFDRLVADMKNFLNNSGVGFNELAQKDSFLLITGRARICSHDFYPELEKIYTVKLPKFTSFNLPECKKISLVQAIENVKKFIY